MTTDNILTVTQINQYVRSWLETELGVVTVTGELSNLAKPSSGHLYFTLKDEAAQLRAVFFRNYHDQYSRLFKDGQQVVATGKLSLYEARGEYQLLVYSLCEAGLGTLYRQFEELKAKLQAQGLFNPERKKAIPSFPSVIGIVTSPHAAALQDILTTLARRFPIATVKIYASDVQGDNAPRQLIKAIKQANQDNEVDVLLLARGGGSIEDLWAFNNEELALTISQSLIPIVSGIGHETDFTIADFVADYRAATPTAAAETITPNQVDLINHLLSLEKRMVAIILSSIQHKQLLLSHRNMKLSSPDQLIRTYWQNLDYFEHRLNQSIHQLILKQTNNLALLLTTLNARNPKLLLASSHIKCQHLEQQLKQIILLQIGQWKQRLMAQFGALDALSPLATLKRGYAIATYAKEILYKSSRVNRGDEINIQLAQGKLLCTVIGTEND